VLDAVGECGPSCQQRGQGYRANEGCSEAADQRKKSGGLIRTRDGPVILSPKVPKMLTSPIEPSLDPSLRVLSLPLAAINEAPLPIGALAGLPAGALDIASANLLMAATPCDAPLFDTNVEAACARFKRDVMLVRTGLFPETMNPVTVDIALVGPDGPFTMKGLTFMRQCDGGLWLVPDQTGAFVEICSKGLALHTAPPFVTWDERCDGVCRAAGEIVCIVTGRRGR